VTRGPDEIDHLIGGNDESALVTSGPAVIRIPAGPVHHLIVHLII
jgi:hypothetical protein